MKERYGKFLVEVVHKGCTTRSCFALGFDKGTFVQGVGYRSYHRDHKGNLVEYPVCGTRHYHGCPVLSVCPLCRALSSLLPGTACEWGWCNGVTIEREEHRP